jgi:hypothetical protein
MLVLPNLAEPNGQLKLLKLVTNVAGTLVSQFY